MFAFPFKSKEEVRCWAERYCAKSKCEEWELEEALEKIIAPKARQLGYLNGEDLLQFCKWKSPRALAYCKKNIETYVEDITRIAFSCQNERVRIEVLTLLRGVSWPMASVVLHFWSGYQYPILDRRALSSLRVKEQKSYSFYFWWRYTLFCRKASGDHEVSMRTLDRALWQYDKESS